MAAEATQEQEVIADETESTAEETESGQAAAQPAAETVAEPEVPTAGQAKKYYVVAGMFSSRTNAENFVRTLTSQGHDAELFGRHGELYAVSFSSHVLRAAAVEEMNRIREEINPDAWLLYY
jgi:cell division septation protein DedD